MEIIWKDIPKYEGLYQASTSGEVRSLDRIVVRTDNIEMPLKGKVLTLCKNKKGYLVVTLKRKSLKVHRLVMITFYGESELQVDHINGIRDDNRLPNLRYVTGRKNVHFSMLNRDCSSKYPGVRKSKSEKYYSTICINKIYYFLGSFECEYTAHLVFQEALKNWELFKIVPIVKSNKNTYKNIGFHKASNKWTSRIVIEGIRYHLGVFLSELEAFNRQQEAHYTWVTFNKKPK